jgi:hypothetical protein
MLILKPNLVSKERFSHRGGMNLKQNENTSQEFAGNGKINAQK